MNAGGSAGSGATGVVGLDVGGSKVHGVLLLDGAVVAELRLPVRRGPDGVVAVAAEVVERLLVRPRGAVLSAVGLGVPGVVTPGTGVVEHAVHLDIVRPEPLGSRLSALLGVPVVVENDLTVAALGAAHVLDLGGDLAYLAIGTGLAAGLVLDGRLRRGHVGAAGEIGHVPYRLDGPPCACGQRGCLETYASGSALDAAWPSRSGHPAPAEVFAAAARGDERATALRDAFADAVAVAVQVLVLTADVQHVVLGGGVAAVGEPLRDEVARACRRRAATSPFLTAVAVAGRVRLAPPGVALAPLGAALATGPGASPVVDRPVAATTATTTATGEG